MRTCDRTRRTWTGFLASLGLREDRYDPEVPLSNLAWPVLIRGQLYRVDAEVMIGMEGQPDLGWDEFDSSEVHPAPSEVVAADALRSRP
jgi:hypothetical protein